MTSLPETIVPEQFDAWPDTQCREVAESLAVAYRDAMDYHLKRYIKQKCTTARDALKAFARYYNGRGKPRILRHRKTIDLRKQLEALRSESVTLFRIDDKEIDGIGRHPRVVSARMFITHIMHRRGLSYPEIGTLLGGRNHSTVITADQRLIRMMQDGATFEIWDGSQFTRLDGPAIIARIEKVEGVG